MNIFYSSGFDGEFLLLDEQESFHCIKVLRSRSGDRVKAIDGAGGFYEAEVLEMNPKACRLKILIKHDNYLPLSYQLHIGIAPTKNIDRFEWFLEKATEIGISEITPLICERSERKSLRMDRLDKVVISAMKQSEKAYKPQLNGPLTFTEWIGKQSGQTRLIAHCEFGEKVFLWQKALKESISIAIGPEGDFTTCEIEEALKNGFEEISLGNYRLRTETAGVVACSSTYIIKNQ